MVFSQEYVIPGTKGVKIEFEGRTYTTVEDIHYEICEEYNTYSPRMLCRYVRSIEAQCTTDDPKIMWGQDDDSADWFPPTASWFPFYDIEEFDAWLEKRADWSDEFSGVSVCDWD